MLSNQIGILFSAYENHADSAFAKPLATILILGVALVLVHLVLCLARRTTAEAKRAWTWWEKLVYLGTIVSVSVLGFTSFFAIFRYGTLGGWLLFAHMFGAGAFVGLLPLLSVTWCEPCRLVQRRSGSDDSPLVFFWVPRLMFWMVLVGGFVVTMTMLLSMLPLFGTDGLDRLLGLHRYAGVLVVVALFIHLYCVALQRLGWR